MWVKHRLETMFNASPRFENSYYGPINSILHSIFPSVKKFLVKPQAVLLPNEPIVSSIYLPPGTTKQHPDTSCSSSRIAMTAAKAFQGDGSKSHSSKASISSIDSLGDNILPRSMGGWIDGLFIPDFLVVKATEEKTKDVALVIVEVKLNRTGMSTSINQVKQYLNCLQTKHYSSEFVAFLCMGADTMVWTTSGDKPPNLMQTMLPGYVRTGGLDFCRFMLPAQRKHWE